MTDIEFYADESLMLEDGKPEEPRGQYSRYILPRGDGQAMEYTRTTTLVGIVDSGVGLMVWAKYRAAWGVAQRDDLIARLRAVPVDDKITIREVCDKAELIAGTDAAANDGTAAHAVLQRVDQGEPIENIHPYYQPLVRNYQAELAAKGITVIPEYVERTCRCAHLDTAGKPDNIYRLADGSLVIGDKKTTSDLARAERAISSQLGIYANCEHMWDYVAGRYEPMPPVRKDFALIVLIDTDTWAVTIERINIEYGWARTRLMVELRESNKVKGLVQPYLPEGRWDYKPKTVLPSSNGHATPSVERSPESTARIQEIADGVRRDSAAKLAAAVQTGPVGAPDASPTPQAAAMSTPQPPATVGPTPSATPPPTPESYLAPGEQPMQLTVGIGQPGRPGLADIDQGMASGVPVVDPTTRVQEILEVRKNDKSRLQQWSRDLGNTDLAHNRKWLAEWIVKATPTSGAIEPGSGPSKINSSENYGGENARHPQTLAEAGLPPAPPEPPGVPVVQDNTPEMLTRRAAEAASLDVLRAVWKQYTDTYGPDSWDTSGPVKAAADARADFLKRQAAGDDGPPF